MANIHIALNSNANDQTSKMVYADLSLSATPAIIPLKEVYVGTYKSGALSAEERTTDYYGEQVQYVTDDPLDTTGKLKFYSNIIPSS